MSLIIEPRENHKLDLAAEILDLGGVIRVQASGASMLPTIWPGDVLVIQSKAGLEIVRGDIVLVAREGRFFIHRLVGRSNAQWMTRGDSMPQNDPPWGADELLGRVTAIHRKGSVRIPQMRVSLPAYALAWMLCRSDTLRNVALRAHSFWRNRGSVVLSEEQPGLWIDGMRQMTRGFRDE
jgi:peptidase S24-like protein